MGSPSTLLDLIAHGGSLRAQGDNDQQAAATALTQAQTGRVQQEAPILAQQAEQARLETQRQQQALRDQEIMRQVWAQPDANDYLTDPNKLRMALAQRGASAPGVMSAVSSAIDLNTKASTLKKDQIANEEQEFGVIKDGLIGYLNTPDEQKPQAYPSVYADIQKREPQLAAALPAPGAGVAPNQNDLAHVIGLTKAHEQLLTNAKTKAETEQAEAGGREKSINAKIAELNFNLRRDASPETLAAQVDSLIDPAKYPDQNAQAKSLSATAMKYGGPEAATKAIQDVYGQVAEAQKQALTAPGRLQEELDKQKALMPGAVLEAAQKANAEIGPHVAAAVASQKALAAQSPDAFAGIVDASSRRQAESESDKIDQTYTDALNTNQRLRDTISAAQSGNKAAPAVIPIEELRGFVNRVNSTELKSVGGAGNLVDKVEGYINGKTKGQPIAPDVLRDMKDLLTSGDQFAERAYSAGVDRLKKRGVDASKLAKPTITGAPAAKTYAQTATGPNNHKIGSNDGGKTWFDLQTGAAVK